jgi:cytoskeletal protein CcmA (bactofilin family)
MIRMSAHGHAGRKGEVEDMLNNFKNKAPEQDKSVAASAAEVIEQAQRSVVETIAPKPERTTKPGPASCIGAGMSVVGKIECNGPAHVFGRIEGELRASDLLIGDGAEIEGSVIAQNVTVCGSVKGTIHAVRVKLQNGGTVEGDIFHKSLSIDENSLFEGSSRRVENPMDPSSSVSPKKKDTQSPAPSPSIGADLQRVESARAEWSESTVGTKQ